MNDLRSMAVFDSADDLLKESAALHLAQPMLGGNEREQLAAASVFHHQQNALGRVQHLEQFDDVRVLHRENREAGRRVSSIRLNARAFQPRRVQRSVKLH